MMLNDALLDSIFIVVPLFVKIQRIRDFDLKKFIGFPLCEKYIDDLCFCV